jgi:hypothetical protein
MAAVEARVGGNEIADARQEAEPRIQRYWVRRCWVAAAGV